MNLLEVKELTKHYKAFTLDHVSFALPAGCIMGLIGQNGAGKSTVLRLILNAVGRDGGCVTIFGKDNRENTALLKEDIGVVTDEIGFPECLTAKQVNNIMKNTFTKWDEAYFYHLLARLAVPVNKAFKDFSRGMRMKLGIAVALSHNPKLLLLDEPTSGLDPVVRDEVTDIFMEFTRDENRSVLISSHIVSDLEKVCDYIAFLHKGRLILCEEKDRLYEEYCMVHLTKEQLPFLDSDKIIGKKETPYNITAVIRKDAVTEDIQQSSVTLEELFVFMAKGE